MCGIVGVVGLSPAAPLLLDGLKRLEYRGYDSAGIATLVNGHIERRRAEGKLKNLAAVVEHQPLAGTTGIGHTRWATHGAPTESNAHPHATARVAVVHNGIIENHNALRAELEAKGQKFASDTDTETVVQLLDLLLAQGLSPIEAAKQAFARLEGAYALALIFAGHPELVIGAQRGAPLAVGFGAEEMYLGSDALALAPLTREIAYLEDGDWVVVTREGAEFYDSDNAPVHRAKKLTALTGAAIGKGNFRHFMEKELHEHPVVIGDVLHRMLDGGDAAASRPALRPRGGEAHHHERLRLCVLRRAHRQVLAGKPRPRAGGGRRGQRVPLPRPAAGGRRSGPAGQPVRRDRRHAGGVALHEGGGAKHSVRFKCAGKLDGP